MIMIRTTVACWIIRGLNMSMRGRPPFRARRLSAPPALVTPPSPRSMSPPMPRATLALRHSPSLSILWANHPARCRVPGSLVCSWPGDLQESNLANQVGEGKDGQGHGDGSSRGVDHSRLFDGIYLSSPALLMLLRNPDLTVKGVREECTVARLGHLLSGLALTAAEQLMPMLILKRPLHRVHQLMPAM